MAGATLHAREYIYSADPLVTAGTAFTAIFAILFSALSVLSFKILLDRQRREYRSTYIPLLLSLVFSALQNATSFVVSILDANIASAAPTNTLFAFIVIDNFVFFWAYPLFFLAFFNLLLDRLNNTNAIIDGAMGRMCRLITISFRGVLALLFVFATTAAALQTDYEHFAIYSFLNSSISVGEFESGIEKRVRLSSDMLYVFMSIWVVSAFVINFSTITLYRAMKRASTVDKITSNLTFAGGPLYALMTIMTLVFIIVLSPVGIGVDDNVSAIEGANLAQTILENASFAAAAGLLVILGLDNSCWKSSLKDNKGVAQSESLLLEGASQQIRSESAFYTPSHMLYEPYVPVNPSESVFSLKART